MTRLQYGVQQTPAPRVCRSVNRAYHPCLLERLENHAAREASSGSSRSKTQSNLHSALTLERPQGSEGGALSNVAARDGVATTVTQACRQ